MMNTRLGQVPWKLILRWRFMVAKFLTVLISSWNLFCPYFIYTLDFSNPEPAPLLVYGTYRLQGPIHLSLRDLNLWSSNPSWAVTGAHVHLESNEWKSVKRNSCGSLKWQIYFPLLTLYSKWPYLLLWLVLIDFLRWWLLSLPAAFMVTGPKKSQSSNRIILMKACSKRHFQWC